MDGFGKPSYERKCDQPRNMLLWLGHIVDLAKEHNSGDQKKNQRKLDRTNTDALHDCSPLEKGRFNKSPFSESRSSPGWERPEPNGSRCANTIAGHASIQVKTWIRNRIVHFSFVTRPPDAALSD